MHRANISLLTCTNGKLDCLKDKQLSSKFMIIIQITGKDGRNFVESSIIREQYDDV